jgi:hypothetical protein
VTEKPTKAEDTDSEQAQAQEDAERPHDRDRTPEPPAQPASFWRRYDQQLVGALLVLLGTLIVSWLSPLGGVVFRTADDIRDFFRSYNGKIADNHKEDIERRDDFWVSGPRIFEDSIAVIAEDERDVTEITDDGFASAYPVTAIVDDAPEHTGVPLIFVGKVRATRSRGLDDFGDLEMELVGTRSGAAVYVQLDGLALAGTTSGRPGDIVQVHGVVTAQGAVQGAAGRREQAVYFAGFNVYDAIDPITGRPEGGLDEMVRELQKKRDRN